MTRLVGFVAVTAIVALAGCGTADPGKRKAGSWKTEATVEKLDISGVPAGAEAQVAAMKSAMSAQLKSQFGREQCLSAETAAKENISKDFLQGLSSGGKCELTTDKVGGGKFDLAGVCAIGPSKMNVALKGTQGAEKIDAVVSMTGGGDGGAPKLDMRMKVVTTRTGDCAA